MKIRAKDDSDAQSGTTVTKIYNFAGKGAPKPLKIENHLINQYGGQKGQWQHTTGDVQIKTGNVLKTAEVYWFQESSIGIAGPFVKRWR